ncbi:MAG: NUDIX domain-containing protein [Candidatus Wildermuthbacteria bacterium]|nr:NUDIX domain-containing protein [Candidatus Wildermuthbacteria bacterium]
MTNNKDRHRIIPAAYVILQDGNKILLQRRYNTGYEDGNYSFVSGHVEQGESYINAIIREAKEEAGVELRGQDLRFVHLMHRKGEDSYNERADVFFVAARWSGEIANVEPHKCDDLSWFDKSDLPENLIPYIREVLGYIDKDVMYSEYGWR